MKLKQKEILIEKKHQELDLKEEKCIRELDLLAQNERSLCQILAAKEMEIITGEQYDEYLFWKHLNSFI
jgi:hypothetical protein